MSPPILRIRLTRDTLAPAWTLGVVELDLPDDAEGFLPFGFSVEDTDRRVEEDLDRKVRGATAIPVGVYGVRTTWSPKFGRPVPLVEGVPGFRGIRIHPGKDSEDTEGCLILGLQRDVQAGTVSRSRPACDWLYNEIRTVETAGGTVTLEVRRAP